MVGLIEVGNVDTIYTRTIRRRNGRGGIFDLDVVKQWILLIFATVNARVPVSVGEQAGVVFDKLALGSIGGHAFATNVRTVSDSMAKSVESSHPIHVRLEKIWMLKIC